MGEPVTSIIIPTYNHARYLPDAIDCALGQRDAAVEVIVVDDASTDETSELLARYGDRIRVRRFPEQRGPSAARNAGLDMATGEYVMFLDADDLIEPSKVSRQLLLMTEEVGWVLCDVRIEDETRARPQLASERYDYKRREIGGWIAPKLEGANFIPIMSPLVRASVAKAVRFDDSQVPEDWFYWRKIATLARCRYLPEVLATYRKKRTGRSRLPKKARMVEPNVAGPLRLNLGCGTPGTRSWHPIEGFVNLDKSLGWRFEDGLGDFADGTVAGITVSHSLMYVLLTDLPQVFREFFRVLAVGGIVRITEDDARNPKSSRYGGWKGSEPAVSLLDARLILGALADAGFEAREVTADTTHYRDRSLMQAQHGAPPDVFFVEGRKPGSVLFAPHNDDEALFAAFTILRHRPQVVVCFGSSGDYGDSETREAESRDACQVLGAAGLEQWKGGDLVSQMRELDSRMRPDRVWAPHPRTSHPDHRAVAEAAAEVFAGRLATYHTYDAAGKVREGEPVPFEPTWLGTKHRALARYESQIAHPRASKFFAEDLLEYAGGAR